MSRKHLFHCIFIFSMIIPGIVAFAAGPAMGILAVVACAVIQSINIITYK